MAFGFVALAVLASPQSAFAAQPTIVQPSEGGTPWTAAGLSALRSELDATLSASPALRGAHYGVYAVDTSTGTIVYARNSDAEIQPASTFKLVVGSAALEKLGADFRFKTTLSTVRARSNVAPVSSPPPQPDPSPNASLLPALPPVDAGPSAAPSPSLAPDATSLVLTFGGDPTLSRGDLRAAVNALDAPLYQQTYVDDSAFDQTPYANGWTWDDFGQDYAPRISAATLDENVVGVSVSPGDDVGEPAALGFKIPQTFTFAPGEPCAGMPLDFIRSQAITGAKGSDDTIDVAPFLAGCQRVVGSIPFGASSETIGIPMPDPPSTIAALFDSLIVQRGIRLAAGHQFSLASSGGPALRPNRGTMPDPPIWIHTSQPLGELLGPSFWIPSDNLFGELLLKQLGLQTGGKPGTTAKGIAYEKQWLHGIGVDTATMTFADGCGMSQYDRITPRDLVAILQHDWNGPNRQVVLDSLPVGGARGTIEGIAGTPAAGRVFAKTGSMMHVRGLAGYLATVHHGAVTFAFSVDDWNGDYGSLAALRAAVLSRIVSD